MDDEENYLYEYLKLHDVDEDNYSRDDFEDWLADVKEEQENA